MARFLSVTICVHLWAIPSSLRQPLFPLAQSRRSLQRQRSASEFERLRVILGAMLVVFRELFHRPHPERIAARRQVVPHAQRGVVAAQFAFQRGNVPQRSEQNIVGQAGVDRAPEKTAGLLRLA